MQRGRPGNFRPLEPDAFRDFVQVAGVRSLEEARMLTDCGVRYLGFPLRLPVNAVDLPEAEAATVIRCIRPPAFGVAITYQDDADDIARFTDYLGASIVQLHGDISASELKRLRLVRPALGIIKSLVVGERARDHLIAQLEESGELVDAFITDTFDPETGASGATGKTHDWRISRELVRLSPRPVILAGGLTPDNVREAILSVAPEGVDAHTGLEDASGRKDRAKVLRFVAEARDAFRLLRASGKMAHGQASS
jgi:phosphoribosylanthranilate isomerase